MNVLKVSLRISSILSFLLLLALGTHAQYRAGLSGTVTDRQGGVVSNAKVTVTSNETGVSQEAMTDDNGSYTVNRLAPGLYKVTVEKDGFKQAVLDNVQVAGEQMNPANVILDVGAIAESVTVNGDQLPAIDTESGQIAGTVTDSRRLWRRCTQRQRRYDKPARQSRTQRNQWQCWHLPDGEQAASYFKWIQAGCKQHSARRDRHYQRVLGSCGDHHSERGLR
jgi:hypothetical protein